MNQQVVKRHVKCSHEEPCAGIQTMLQIGILRITPTDDGRTRIGLAIDQKTPKGLKTVVVAIDFCPFCGYEFNPKAPIIHLLGN
jgi:hypothetical protein